jgi:hypothetical protein
MRFKRLKIFSILIFLSILILSGQVEGAQIYLGEFAIGESFVDDYISYSDGSVAKVSVIFRGTSGNGVLLYIASFPETPYLIAPGYCLIEKKSSENSWTFLIGFGVTGDRVYQIQKNTYNQIKLWRIQ